MGDEMKLYFMPGACSLAPHITLREAGMHFDLIEVDYQSRQTTSGQDFYGINPKGYVPALVLDDGVLLTEVPVILQYIDAQCPEARLLPSAGAGRLQALEWLNYVATEIHKSFSPLFRPTTPKAFLKPGRDHLVRRLEVVETSLQANRYLGGEAFSLSDIYLFTTCRWLADQQLTLDRWPALGRHFGDVASRKSVQAALAREGLVTPDIQA